MTNEQKVALADKVIANREAHKGYSRFRNARLSHELSELKRVIQENKLENELKPFDKTPADFE